MTSSRRTRTARLLTGWAVAGAGLVVSGGPPVEAFGLTFLADTLSDNPADGYTLREALAQADLIAGHDTVGFEPGLAGTVTLNSPLVVGGSVTIQGPEEGGIVISADHASRVIQAFQPSADLTLRHLTLTAGTSANAGGAISVMNGGDLLLDHVEITDSSSQSSGGGLAVRQAFGSVTIRHSVIDGNTADGNGGGLFVDDHLGGPVTLFDSVVSDNESSNASGGGVFVDAGSADLVVQSSAISGNESTGADGGGLFATAGRISLDQSEIVDNRAVDQFGGVLAISTLSETSLVDSVVDDNEAQDGGAGSISSATYLEIVGSSVSGNRAAAAAGLRLTGPQSVSIAESVFGDNLATVDIGAMIVSNSAEFEMDSTSVTANSAPAHGGMWLLDVPDATISRSTISANTTTAGSGGGIVVEGSPPDALTLDRSTVSGNHAAFHGGGIHSVLVDVDVSFSTIVDNTAGQTGGGISADLATDVTLDHSILASNSAPLAPDTTGPLHFDWSLVGDTTDAALIGGADNLAPSDPMLGPLQDNGGPTLTHLPDAASPVVDVDDRFLLTAPFDQRFRSRPVGAFDIGAVEVQPDDHPPEPDEPAEPDEPDEPAEPDEPTIPDVPPPGGQDPAEGEDPDPSTPGPRVWVPVTPSRFVDTRSIGVTIDGVDQSGGRLSAGTEVRIDIAGRGDVPSDAVAVIANLTAIRPDGIGFATAHPCVSPLPLAASLNYSPDVTLGNESIVGLDDGDMCVFTSSAIDLTVDVVGYVPADSGYRAVVPARFLDTRSSGTTLDGAFAAEGSPGAGHEKRIQVAGRGDVPADARTVVMYVAAIRGDGTGYVTIWDCDSPRPLASSLNHVLDVNRGNEVVVGLGEQGDACLFTSNDVDVTVDVTCFLPSTVDDFRSAEAPSRLLDTRPDAVTVDGRSAATGVVPAGSTVVLDVAGRAGIPEGAATVTMNLTAVQPIAVGYVTAHACDVDRPNAASLNHVPGVNGGNEIVASLDADGRMCLFTSTDVHLTADVTGWTFDPESEATGTS